MTIFKFQKSLIFQEFDTSGSSQFFMLSAFTEQYNSFYYPNPGLSSYPPHRKQKIFQMKFKSTYMVIFIYSKKAVSCNVI